MEKKIFTFWTGSNSIPEVRLDAIRCMKINSGVEVSLYLNDDLQALFENVSVEIHPAYFHLNYAHRADYLRAFCMHYYGGGYCDVKEIKQSWVPYFKIINDNSSCYAIGYKETSRHHVANIYQSTLVISSLRSKKIRSYVIWRTLQTCYRLLIGNGAFIFKPKTPLTHAWWSEVNKRLDFLLPALEKNPAKFPKERGGHTYDGVLSKYPVPWSYLLGDILHPLALRYAFNISRKLEPPVLSNYQ